MIRLSIRRPVTIAMAYGALSLLGIASWRNISIELLPNTSLPRLSINANWPGASPEITEAFLTAPIEAATQQVRGIERVTSTSGDQFGSGTSSVEAYFALGTDMDFARLELSERLAALEDDLPPTASRPRLEDYVPEEFQDQTKPFLSYTVTGPYTLEALRAYLDDRLIPELVRIQGVGDVQASGGNARLLEIELVDSRIDALGLSLDDVSRAVRGLEVVQQAGQISQAGMLHVISLREHADDAAEVRELPLITDGGGMIRIKDVAIVRDTYAEPNSYYRIDGQPALTITVYKEHGVNAVRVADQVKSRLMELEGGHPTGVRLILDSDESDSIRAQLSDLRNRALIAAAIVFGVLLIFLRSWRSAGLAFASMSAAVLITLNLIYIGGLSLNLLTLMGLAMGFGMIIDNSVVVLDSIYRERANGASALEAAENGARAMVLPVLAATLTTLVVLIPFLYLQGELRVYYVPLAIVVGLTNAASLFVSFSLLPALAWRGLRRPVSLVVPNLDGPPIYRRIYAGLTGWTLRHPWVTVAIALGMLGGSFYLFDNYVTRGVVWGSWGSTSTYLDIRITLPRGEELARTQALAQHFEDQLRAMPEVGRFVSRVSPQYANIRVTFPDSINNSWIPVAISTRLEAYSHEFGGADVRVIGYGPSFYGGGGSPAPNYAIQVFGFNYETVRDIAEDLQTRLLTFPRIENVDPNASGQWYERDRATELVLNIDRERAALQGLAAQDIVRRVQAGVSGGSGRGSTIRVGGEELRFAVKLAGYQELDDIALHNLLLPSAHGQGVRLGEVATLNVRQVQTVIRRENQEYERSVAYEFRGPTKLGDLVQNSVVNATELPPGYRLETSGVSWSTEERQQVYGVLVVSLLLVFMVTAALFESLRQPLVVLLSVPMALVGVFLVFFYTGASFTREAYIGVIMMGGVVVNNAILLVDHINVVRGTNDLPLGEAILQATLDRVRPILMTTLTTVLGLLPLVLFSESSDANIWNALGYALIGGLTSSTFLILTVTPALYLLLAKTRGKDLHAAT